MMVERQGSKLRRALLWGDVRNRKLGMWAYALSRITGIGLVVYLYLHLVVLSLLAQGASGWDAFIALARTPVFLALDVILLVGLLIHGLNGLRVTINALNIGVPSQKLLFILVMALVIVVGGYGAIRIFTQ
jgi:succinate dehydrogenase / fumarate reductase cytochrome b subunit